MQAVEFPVNDMAMFLTVTQLAFRGALRPTDLAQILGTVRSNVTKITRRLEEVGLIARASDPDDDRGVLIALTSSGRALGQRIIENGESRLRKSLDTWPAQDRRDLERLLAKMVDDAIADGYQLGHSPRPVV